MTRGIVAGLAPAPADPGLPRRSPGSLTELLRPEGCVGCTWVASMAFRPSYDCPVHGELAKRTQEINQSVHRG